MTILDPIFFTSNIVDLFRHLARRIKAWASRRTVTARLLVLDGKDRSTDAHPVVGARVVVNGQFIGDTNVRGMTDRFRVVKGRIQVCIFTSSMSSELCRVLEVEAGETGKIIVLWLSAILAAG